MTNIKPTLPRTALLLQNGTNKSVRLDGTKDFTVHPTRDLHITVSQAGHPDTVFPNSNEISIFYSGSWPKDNPPPPPGGLTLDMTHVDRSSTAYTRFLAYVDRALAGHPDYLYSGTDAAYAYRLSNLSQYGTEAVARAEAQVAAAEAAIAAGHNPAIANDSYLDAGGMISDIALAYAWCASLLTVAQKQRFAAYASQTMYNLRNPSLAQWGGRNAPWSGWAVSDPANNYYYSFTQAMLMWALASGDAELLNYVHTVEIPRIVNFYATIPGGGSLEGTGYGTSHQKLFEDYVWYRDSGQGNLTNTHLTNSIYFWLHATMANWENFVPLGSQSRVSMPTIFDYQINIIIEALRMTSDAGAINAGLFWLGRIRDAQSGGQPYSKMYSSFMSRYDLFRPTGNAPIVPGLTFRAAEVGMTTGRTGWGGDAVVMETLMGNYSQSHAHPEQGSFVYWCNGAWGSVTNNVFSHSGIHGETGLPVDKNVLVFAQNGTPIRQHNGTVNVLTYVANNATGEYHITGDLSPLYDSNVAWKRRVDFVGNVAMITDQLSLSAGTTATFQLNVPTQPTISGNVITTPNMKATVVSPVNATITAVAMSSVDSDFLSGWRVDIGGSGTGYVVTLEPIV